MSTPIGGQPTGQAFIPVDAQQFNDALLQFGVIKDSMTDVVNQFGDTPIPPTGRASSPKLQPPNANASTKIPVKSDPKPTSEESFSKSFDANLKAQISAKNLTPTELKNLDFMRNNPGVALDDPKMQEKLQGVLKEIYKNVQADLTSQGVPFETDPSTGLLKEPATLQKAAQDKMAAKFDAEFEKALAKQGLSPEDAAKVRFAHYNPGSKDPAILNPKIQAALQNAEGAAIQSMKNQGFIVPNGFKPPMNSEGFNDGISANFSDKMEETIKTMGKAAGLSDQQIEGLIYKFYNPDVVGRTPDIIAQAQSEVMKTLGPQLGLPGGVTPAPNQMDYNALLDGTVSQQFQANLRSSSLTPAQVQEALSNPANMSPETKAIVDAAWNKAIDQVRTEFGLPISWTPGITQLQGAKPNPLSDATDQADQMVRGAINQLQNMPNTPENQNYLNYLKNVSEAISTLKRIVGMMQGMDAKMGSVASKAQLEKSLYKAEKKAEKMKEVQEKMAKFASMKAIGPAMKAVIIAVLLVIAVALFCTGFLAGIGAAILAILVVVIVLFTIFAIADEVVKADPNASPEAKQALGICDIVMQVIAMIVMTIVTFGSTTAALAADVGASAAELGTEAATAGVEAGVTAGAEAAAEAGAEVAAQVTAEATAETVAQTTVETAAQTVAKEGTQNLLDKLKDVLKQVSQKVKDLMESQNKEMARINRFGDLAQSLPEIAKQSSQCANKVNEARIALLKGDMEAFDNLMKTIIKLLKKLVSQCLGSVNDLGDWLKTIGEMETGRQAGMEKALNNIRS